MANKKTSHPKIAILHDSISEWGGAEKTLEHIVQLFPNADVFVGHLNHEIIPKESPLRKKTITETFLGTWQIHKRSQSLAQILSGWAFWLLDLKKYDVILICSSFYFTRAIRRHSHQTVINYCFTPPRFLYGLPTMSYQKSNTWWHRFGIQLEKIIDVFWAQLPDIMLAISATVQKRIAQYYERDSLVIYPPVSLPKFTIVPKRDYYVFVGRLSASKHPELAIAACAVHASKLIIIGDGPNKNYLQQLAQKLRVPCVFTGNISDKAKNHLIAQAKAMLCPYENEDFGITAVEAMAVGTPVVAHQSGGLTEIIESDVTGIFFSELTVPSLLQAMKKIDNVAWHQTQMRAQSIRFSEQQFYEKMQSLVLQLVQRPVQR